MTTTLVTGGLGFIGSHLVEALRGRGDRVLVLDDGSAGVVRAARRQGVEVVIGDVRDTGVLAPLVARADCVFHLAAAVGVKLLAADPLDTIERNVDGTAAVLRACSENNTPVLIASSSEVYGCSTRMPFGEGDELVLGPSTPGSRWPYAVSKLVGEHLGLAYVHRQGLPVVIARLFNTAGPGQSARHGMVIPRFVEQALSGNPITVYGDGSQGRCFCHVKEVAAAMCELLETPAAYGQVVNIGGSETVSIIELARRIRHLTRSPSEILRIPFSDAYHPGFADMADRRPDLSRIWSLIGFAPRLGLEDILADVIEHALIERQENLV
jgi:UDP-glucose 4-epimerase